MGWFGGFYPLFSEKHPKKGVDFLKGTPPPLLFPRVFSASIFPMNPSTHPSHQGWEVGIPTWHQPWNMLVPLAIERRGSVGEGCKFPCRFFLEMFQFQGHLFLWWMFLFVVWVVGLIFPKIWRKHGIFSHLLLHLLVRFGLCQGYWQTSHQVGDDNCLIRKKGAPNLSR